MGSSPVIMMAMGKPDAKLVLPLLTEMRGVAALLIYHLHLVMWILPAMQLSLGRGWPLLQRAYLAVDFFFILSGFVLTHVYQDWFFPAARPQGFIRFLLARFGRVYPLHFIASTLFLFIILVRFGDWRPGAYLHDIFLLNSFPKIGALNGVSWSISSECIAYLFAPFFIRIVRGLSGPRLGLAFAASMLGLVAVVWHYRTLDVHSVFRCIPEFIFGIICYECYRRRPVSSRCASLVGTGAVLLVPVSLAWIDFKPLGDLVSVTLLCAVVYAAVQVRGVFVTVFHRVFGHLGDVSYSIYLIHPLLFATLLIPAIKAENNGPGGYFAIYCIYTAALIGIATLTHRYVEVPGRALFKMLPVPARGQPSTGKPFSPGSSQAPV